MSAAIEITDLIKTYPARDKGAAVHALTGVSLSIPRGEFYALLGPNGAGKTSLISIISGLAVKTGGEVSICGVSIDAQPSKAKTFIGLVPQEFNFSIFERVIDIIIDQAGYYGITRAEAMPYAEKLLTSLGLWEKRNMKAETLSGGMKRRLMIARALIHKPAVLLLDEPTAGVDVELRRSMWEFLRELNEGGTTILLTTHYLEEVEQLCKRAAIINKGTVIEEGSVKDLVAKLGFVNVLLDTAEPVTEAMLQLLRDYPVKRADDHTLEVTLPPGGTLNDLFRKLTSIGVNVVNVRNSGNRLEEVFMNLIGKA